MQTRTDRRTMFQAAGVTGAVAMAVIASKQAGAHPSSPVASPPTVTSLNALASGLTGTLLTPDSPEYDAARQTIYITVDRRPLAIVRAANAEDIALGVQFARDNNLPLAVRSGGHSLAHLSVIDDALVIDLGAMTRVEVDPESGIATVEAGATTADLLNASSQHGLALSTGDTSSVGMGGLTTGGGIGLMVRSQGLTIDSLLSARIVTASSEILETSETQHPDLFWAIRGGGGNFGIVSDFTFRLTPLGDIVGGMLYLPASREVIRGYLDYSVSAPDGLTTIANLTHAPSAPFVPTERVGEMVLTVLVNWSGDPAAAEDALAPLRALAEPVVDTIAPMPYPAIYDYTAPQAEPHAASIRMMFADDLGDTTIDTILEAVDKATSPLSTVQFRGLGGAMATVPEDATAFAHRSSNLFVAIIGLWIDPDEEATPHQTWTNDLWNVLHPEATGVYVNFLEDEGDARVHEAYPAPTYERLAAVKRTYDPDNLFHFNQNIAPGN